MFGGPETVHRKYEILAEHCAAVGRPYAEIERSNLQGVDLSPGGARGASAPNLLVDRFGDLADAGVQHVIMSPHSVDPGTVEALGAAIIPQLRDL